MISSASLLSSTPSPDRSNRKARKKGKASAEKQGEIGQTLRSERRGIETYYSGPMDFAKTLKLRLRVGDLDLPERRKVYTGSQEGEEEGEEVTAHMCPRGKAIESRIHIVGECEIFTWRNGMCKKEEMREKRRA